MFHIIYHQGHGNLNNEIPLHTHQNGQNLEHCQRQMLVRMWCNVTLNHHWWEWKMVQPHWSSLVVSYKIKHTLTLQSSNPTLLDIYQRRWKLMSTQKPAHGFTAALFMTAKTWKQPGYPSVGEWIHKLVHWPHGILFSTKQKWAIKTWKDMEKP